MTKATRIWVGAVIFVVLLLGSMGLSWISRGVYDSVFMLEGTVLVVNTTDQPIDVTLDFPSGRQHQYSIPPHGSQRFTEKDTGEGSIGVLIPGRPTESVGYVTSMNGMIVLSSDDNSTTFSQVFP